MVTKPSIKLLKKLHSVSKLDHEKAAWQNNQVVCGIDEVGRGCLAGPVVSAAVIFPTGAIIDGVRDSKLITPKELPVLADKIMKASWWSLGIIDNYLIDTCNIREATMLSMSQALSNLLAICPRLPKKVLVDAMPLGKGFGPDIEFISAPKGEEWSYSIAAASIIAKVKRDSLMEAYNKIFPDLYFDKHKGYGTKVHQAQLDAVGKTLIHRNTFLKKIKNNDKNKQYTLF